MAITLELTPDEEARLWSEAAQQQQPPEAIAHHYVIAALDAKAPAAVSEEDHERLVQRLLDLGMMTERPTRPLGPPPPPIQVLGPPVSQTLLEDRE